MSTLESGTPHPGQYIALVSLLVPSYDEGIDYFTHTLGFTVTANEDMGGGKRWVVVYPPGVSPSTGCGIVLVQPMAGDARQLTAVGNQAGGRVWLFLHSQDFERDYQRMRERGVEFTEAVRSEPYGRVVVFRDKFGNLWDFMEAKKD